MPKTSLPQQIADTLYHEIMSSDQYAPGTRLESENKLSRRLNVSRTTLREAIRILEMQGIVQVYRGKGTYITDTVKGLRNPDIPMNARSNARLRDLFEARLFFEPNITSLAAVRASKEELDRIIENSKKVEKNILSEEDRSKNDQEFHRSIVAAAHNEFLMQLVPTINEAIFSALLTNASDKLLSKNTLYDHRQIVEFLRDRNAEGAQRAMYIHILHIMKSLHLYEK